jgi:hypothetical protein
MLCINPVLGPGVFLTGFWSNHHRVSTEVCDHLDVLNGCQDQVSG